MFHSHVTYFVKVTMTHLSKNVVILYEQNKVQWGRLERT